MKLRTALLAASAALTAIAVVSDTATAKNPTTATAARAAPALVTSQDNSAQQYQVFIVTNAKAAVAVSATSLTANKAADYGTARAAPMSATQNIAQVIKDHATATYFASSFNVAARAAPAINLARISLSVADNSIMTTRAAPMMALQNSANATGAHNVKLGFAQSAKLLLHSNSGGVGIAGARRNTANLSTKFAKKTSPAALIAGG